MEPNYTLEDLKDHVAIAGVIRDTYGNILIQRHNKYGFITIPIGKAKSGQTAEQGLMEELFEECDIVLTDFKLILKKDYSYDRRGKLINLVLYLFEIIDYSGIIKNKELEKHSEQKFMSLDEIKKSPYLSDATLLYLESLGFVRDAKI
jgi:ADP-ribose pyrophosphatase YjhB (NUDIX family)